MNTILVLLLSLTFQPSAQPSALQGSFVIMGSVRSTDGRLVDSIRVSLLDDNYQILKTVFTDVSGRYRFPPVRSGAYIIRVMPVGTPYEEVTERVDLQSLTAGRRSRPGMAQEPTLVDLVVKRKRIRTENRVNEVVFAQSIPDAARTEYKIGAERLKDNSDEGIVALKRAVEIFPDYYLALELLGTEYVKRGEFQAALPILRHALEVNRAAPKSLYALGVAYLKLRRPAEAIQWLEKAAEQDGGNVNVHMMLGLAYGYNNSLKEAAASFNKAYQIGGEEAADSHLYLAGIYNKQGRYGDAVRELEAYLRETNSKNVDKTRVREMINKLKAKQRATQ